MFKKHSSHALRAAVCAALAALSCALPAAAQQKSVAVTSIVEHPALDAVPVSYTHLTLPTKA